MERKGERKGAGRKVEGTGDETGRCKVLLL